MKLIYVNFFFKRFQNKTLQRYRLIIIFYSAENLKTANATGRGWYRPLMLPEHWSPMVFLLMAIECKDFRLQSPGPQLCLLCFISPNQTVFFCGPLFFFVCGASLIGNTVPVGTSFTQTHLHPSLSLAHWHAFSSSFMVVCVWVGGPCGSVYVKIWKHKCICIQPDHPVLPHSMQIPNGEKDKMFALFVFVSF